MLRSFELLNTSLTIFHLYPTNPMNHYLTCAARVLVVSDSLTIAHTISDVLENNSCQAEPVKNASQAVRRIQSSPPDIVLLDSIAEDQDLLQTARWVRSLQPKLPIVFLASANGDKRLAETQRLGTVDYLTKPLNKAELDAVLKRHLQHKSVAIEEKHSKGTEKISEDGRFVSLSPEMQTIRRQIESVAQLDVPVLILGENGTGKQTVARLIHELSSRSKCSFEQISCEGFPGEVLDGELFGHVERGTSGTLRIVKGKFEACEHGTVLLKEISQIPSILQPKILHVLQDGKFFRKGGDAKIPIDVRILATNNVNIGQAICDRRLREELFFRLGSFTIELSPLRRRKDDIPPLLASFMDRLSSRYLRPPKPFPASLIDACRRYDWPGNLRELENFVQRYLIMGDESLKLNGLHMKSQGLFLASRKNAGLAGVSPPAASGVGSTETSTTGLKSLLRNLKGETEINAIRDALDHTRWNRRQAARLLNISYRGLLYKIHEYRLSPPPHRSQL
jgi:two-component system response regulator AtoC